MDINNSLTQLVDEITKEILTKVQGQVDQAILATVSQRIKELDLQAQVNTALESNINLAIEKYKPDLSAINQKINSSAGVIINTVVSESSEQIRSLSSLKLQELDYNKLATETLRSLLQDKLSSFEFPERSIPSSSIKFEDGSMTGNAISGGIIKNFGSTGIDDKATACQVTILDTTTVVENNLLTKDLTVKGSTTVEGDLIVKGEVPVNSKFFLDLVEHAKTHVRTDLNGDFFKQYRDIVFDKIKSEGIELSRITLNGKEIVAENKLGSHISESNLQKVGVLKELQVNGEALLNNTLYVSGKRVGINTLEPSSALSVWDEEVEVSISKRKLNAGQIGTPRSQEFIISSNNKDNIVVKPDGSVLIQVLRIGNLQFGSSATAPNFDAEKGTILFNENPNLGGPLGWVSLGGARWANFGIID